MDKYINLQNILSLYEDKISKTVKNKKRLYRFERNKYANITNIIKQLKSDNYHMQPYNIFIIHEPKCRVVISLDLNDKIINHFITEFVLKPKLEKYLDIRNIATRKNMGTDYGIKLTKKYIEQNKKYENFYVLKMDIKKYFYNIDHEIIKGMLKRDLDEKEYNFMCNIIDSTNEEYINEYLSKVKKENPDISLYYKGKGLPIGNLTSQFLSIFYLHALDHFIVHDLKIKHYVRYMDDFILMHPRKEYLYHCKDIIIDKLKKEYKLEVNLKKTKIVSIKQGFEFIGYRYFLKGKKTIVLLRKKTITKIKKRVRELHYLFKHHKISLETYFTSINNYYHSFKYGSRQKIKRIITRYE